MTKKYYLKLLMGLLLVAFIVPHGKADELTVGNGTSSDSYIPLYGSYMDESGTYSQTVYSSTMLSSLARFYYKKTTGSKARPTDKDRLYYVVENQVEIPVNQIITGIDNIANKNVANVKYYNVAGIESDVPFQGVNIEVTTYEDGSRTTRKIMK